MASLSTFILLAGPATQVSFRHALLAQGHHRTNRALFLGHCASVARDSRNMHTFCSNARYVSGSGQMQGDSVGLTCYQPGSWCGASCLPVARWFLWQHCPWSWIMTSQCGGALQRWFLPHFMSPCLAMSLQGPCVCWFYSLGGSLCYFFI